MKYLLLLIALASPALAGQKYGYDDPRLDDEITNIYKELKYPNIVYGRASTMTVTALSVSTITVIGTAVGLNGRVVQTVTANTTSDFTTTSNSFQATNLSASITPRSTANKVLVLVTGTIRNDATAAANALATLFRDSSDIGGGALCNLVGGGGSIAIRVPCAMAILDSPATIAATTYSVRLRNDDGATTVGFNSNETSQIILLEINQ